MDGGTGSSVGLIAGVAVAACVLILAIVLVIIYCFVKLRKDNVKVKKVDDPRKAESGRAESGRAGSSWSTKASSNYTASTHDRSNASQNHHGPDSSQEISSISSIDSVFETNNVSYNPNADDPKDRKKRVTIQGYNNEGFESGGTTGDSSFEKIKYRKNDSRNGSISREAREGSKRRTRQRNASSDKADSTDSRRRPNDGRHSRSQDRKPPDDRKPTDDRKPSEDRKSSSDRKPANGHSAPVQRTHSGSRSSGRSRSRSSGRRARSGSHGRRHGSYARSASSDSSHRSNPKSNALPKEQRPSISNMYANRAFRDDNDRSPSSDHADAASSHPESQV